MDTEKGPIIIDTNSGIGDVVALAIALSHPSLEVRLITTVAGGVDIEKTTNNALKLVDLFGRKVPVAKGCNCPLLIQSEDFAEIHEETGMDGFEFPQPISTCLDICAVEAMRKGILSSDVPLTVVPIAVLTNIALLLALYLKVEKNIAEVVMVDGSLARGNTNTSVESSTYVDPHAIQIVFRSGVPLAMVRLDVTSQAVLTNHEVTAIRALGRVGEMFYGLFRRHRGGGPTTGLKMHNVCAIACLTSPELFETTETFIEVALEGPAAGAIVTNLRMKYHKSTNAVACIDVNAETFQRWVVEKIKAVN